MTEPEAPKVSTDARFDVADEFEHLSRNEVSVRAGRYFGWCLGLLGTSLLIGLLPAMLLFLAGYIRFEGRERWPLALGIAIATSVAWYLLFHQLLRVPWPTTIVGDLLPVLRSSPLTNLL